MLFFVGINKSYPLPVLLLKGQDLRISVNSHRVGAASADIVDATSYTLSCPIAVATPKTNEQELPDNGQSWYCYRRNTGRRGKC